MDGDFLTTSAATVYADCNILILGLHNVLVHYCNRKDYIVTHELARNALIPTNICICYDNPLLLFSRVL